MNIERSMAVTIVCFSAGALIGMAINAFLKRADEKREEKSPEEILVCSGPLGETIPAGKGYKYVYLETGNGTWCLSDERHSCDYYQQIPGEICRVEPLQVIVEKESNND